MMFGELINGLIDTIPDGSQSLKITGITTDSRHVRAGSLFAALPGTRSDGKAYIGDAVRRGASVVIAGPEFNESGFRFSEAVILKVPDPRAFLSCISARFFNHPSHHLKVIGVTGTNGKTTTTFMLKDILEALGHACGIIGTTGARFGSLDFDTGNTTPEAPILHEVLRKMLDAGATHVVMEVSSHALEWRRVDDIRFHAAVFTNLSQDHLDFHREMDTYFVAKRRLFKLLADSSETSEDVPLAVINGDDKYGRQILSYLSSFSGIQRLSFGLAQSSGIRGTVSGMTMAGSTFSIATADGVVSTRCPLPGKHNVLNALAAIGTLYGMGYRLADLCSVLPHIRPVPGRIEAIRCNQPFLVVVDYAHTPDALKNILDALREVTPGRLITVFGCGGDRDRSKRPKMGRVVSERSEIVIVTSDNPRTEKPEKIIEDILPGLVDDCVYEVVTDRRAAIRRAVSSAKEGDTVIIAGKGHETYQIIGRTVFPFDDREEARRALAILGYGT